ncbi:LRR domain containing protein [Parasponia andersonii]|uniref:LRR domain containing protein n=1 Tax=Parasponia andersonii TaxID=3476 RepID=A0A2P5DSY7_PARAD|nr:LRR domain containing protein [Parasponia andersonii]
MEYDQKYAMAMMLCFLFVLLVMLSSFAFVCGDYNIDCQALLKFKKGITSDLDGHLQSWNEANPIGNWTGVT